MYPIDITFINDFSDSASLTGSRKIDRVFYRLTITITHRPRPRRDYDKPQPMKMLACVAHYGLDPV
jgi:hypothetical protein